MDGVHGLFMATLSLLITINIPSTTINKPTIEFLNDEVTANNHYAMDEFEPAGLLPPMDGSTKSVVALCPKNVLGKPLSCSYSHAHWLNCLIFID